MAILLALNKPLSKRLRRWAYVLLYTFHGRRKFGEEVMAQYRFQIRSKKRLKSCAGCTAWVWYEVLASLANGIAHHIMWILAFKFLGRFIS